jgi:hypothetical protein
MDTVKQQVEVDPKKYGTTWNGLKINNLSKWRGCKKDSDI